MIRRRQIARMPLGIEGYRPEPRLAGLIRDIARFVRWIAGR